MVHTGGVFINTVVTAIRAVARLFLIAISLCSGVLGSHGLYVYLFRSEVLLGYNADALFLEWHVPGITASRVIEEVTWQAKDSVALPIVLVVVGAITWITQSMITKRSLYRRVRFSGPVQTSPLAWIMIVAGVVATGYIIANWNSIDHTVASLVIVANTIAVLWNVSVLRR